MRKNKFLKILKVFFVNIGLFIVIAALFLIISDYFMLFKFGGDYGISQNESLRFSEHPYLPYVYKFDDNRYYNQYCSISGKFEKIHYYTNNYGRLGDKYNFMKDTGEYRILVLGGSTSFLPGIKFGEISNINDTWPVILEKKLNSYFKNKVYRVINLAVEGHSSECSLISFVILGVHLKPDLVISYDGINDMAHYFDYEVNRDYSNFVKDFKKSEVKSLKFYIPDIFLKSHTLNYFLHKADILFGYVKTQNIIFNTVNPNRRLNYWYSNSFKNMSILENNLLLINSICNSLNIKFVSSTMHYLSNTLVTLRFNDSLRGFYNKNQIEFFDADYFIPHNDINYKIDEVHFSRKGADCFSDELFKKLITLIKK